VDSRQLTLTVTGPLSLRLSRPALEVGVSGRTSVLISGGRPPYTVGATGLPAGLAIGTDGVITGVPQKAGSYTVTVRLVDAGGSITNIRLPMLVRARLAIATKRIGPARSGHSFSARLAVRGGVSTFRWAVTGGSLPTGLKLSARTGTIAGTPRSAGTFRVTFRVRDALGASSSKTLLLTVG
jgi:hypothetical protein